MKYCYSNTSYLVWFGVQMIAVSLYEHTGGQFDGQQQYRSANGFPFYLGRHISHWYEKYKPKQHS